MAELEINRPADDRIYFSEIEEAAVDEYIKEISDHRREKIFNSILYPAFTKMIESIIRRYKLYVPNEQFSDTFGDTISYLMTKIDHFRREITGYDEVDVSKSKDLSRFKKVSNDFYKEKRRNATEDDPKYIVVDITNPKKKGAVDTKYFRRTTHRYKAYSYCGTISKNYLMHQCSQYSKKRARDVSYDDYSEELGNSMKFVVDNSDPYEFGERMVKKLSEEIKGMVKNRSEYGLSDRETSVGKAIVKVLDNMDTMVPKEGSNKYIKSTVLYLLREESMIDDTKTMRANMKPFKDAYIRVRKQIEQEDEAVESISVSI